MNRAKLRRSTALLLLFVCAGCVGMIQDPMGNALQSPDASTVVLEDGAVVVTETGTPAPSCSPQQVVPGVAPLRRLSHTEYQNSVRDLFPGFELTIDPLVPDQLVNGFENNATVLAASAELVEQYQTRAVSVTARLAELLARGMGTRDLVLPCANPTNATEAMNCGARFVETVGRRVFRRPLTMAERTRYTTFFNARLTEHNFAVAWQVTLQAFLQSPQFLYRLELGPDGTTPTGDRVALTSIEMATRLSYFLWQSTPDEVLLAAAERNELSTAAQIEAQARRMLMDPRARAAVSDFHRQWLDVDRLLRVNKDPNTYAEFNEELRRAMREEQLRFPARVVFDGEGTLRELFTGNRTLVNAPLARLYGVAPPSGEAWMEATLDASRRAGFLTQAGFLASHGHPVNPSPVLRGVFVLERLLCRPPPAPPADVNTNPPMAGTSGMMLRTNRDRYTEHTRNERCSGCHQSIDGIGFALENYDSIGRYRTMDNGVMVDASGRLVGTDNDGPYNGGPALAQRLAQSADVQRCTVRQWFRYALGRTDDAMDRCAIDQLDRSFASNGQRIQSLLLSLVTSDSFRFYRRQGGP